MNRTVLSTLAAATLAALSVFSSSDVAASPRTAPVALAEVSSSAPAAQLPNVAEALRHDVGEAIAGVDWSKTPKRKRYLVSAAVVRLESRRSSGALTASCTVSATLRDAERGNIVAIVEGKARSEEGPRAVAAHAERDALAEAARGAVAALPEALRRLPDR